MKADFGSLFLLNLFFFDMNMKNPIVWFEIYVNDLKRAQQFYETVFQVSLESISPPSEEDKSFQMLSFPSDMNSHGSSGALVKVNGMTAGENSVLVYFESEDCAIEEARIASAGGKVIKSKFSIGEFGNCTLAEDSEGNMFGIHSMA
ncbi:VOC family protein [Aquimarina brevivitae]|uniref:VOC domain-containing protein n=1 Tax=Aquimarina brevivitae TaxID=323412 RepID=A0A4Q7NYD9_9FLAO|nr:VOC family protein [Aquimarina brevivitae]RZS92456.1 hypothetical protein EV197_2594 [Aquimarina brevivitae]